MKKRIVITLIVLILVTIAYAADVKWTALVELTTIADDDILCVHDATANGPKKITVLNFFDTIDTSAELLAILTNETGTGALVFATSPTLVTPILGTITSGVGTALTALDGENIQNDTIDDDSIDFADVTGVDLTLTDCGAITSTGTVTATVGFDIVGAADIDYGSVDVTDHTFVTDGAGDGEIVLPNDSIGDAELNWAGFTDLAAGGVLTGDCVDESHIDDDGIDSEHYNDGSIDLVHLAAGVYAKDLVTTAPITGAADNIFVGADSDVTVAITLLKDVVATSPILIDGGANVDDILPGADADLTISVTVAKDIVTTAPLTGAVDNVIIGTDADITLGIDVLKDLVTTAPVTGGTNDIFPGADADITVALDFTATWDFGGAASLEIPNGTDPDVAVTGQVHLDTDGGNEPNDVSLRTFEGADTQYVIARTLKTLSFTLIEPDQIDAADLIPVWHNTSGYTFTIVEWKAWSDDDDVSLEIEELTDQTDYTAIVTVDAVEIATDGTGVFYASDATITHAAIEHDHSIAIDFDATDTPDYVQISITGWFNADVN